MDAKTLLAERTPAFLATTYRVDLPEGSAVDVRVGRTHPALDEALARVPAEAWTFLTACNPMSQQTDSAENQARTGRLLQALAADGRIAWPGAGIGDDGTWPPEPSVLVVGMAQAEGQAWGRRFEQLAIVCGEVGQPARLVGCV